MALERPVWSAGNRFRFLNRERNFGTDIDWRTSGETRLWQYNLHYFDWLRQADSDAAESRAHITSWIEHNPPFEGIAWEPYPISLRLVNWIGWLGRAPQSSVAGTPIISSIALQAAWLLHQLEFHLGANHLFANVKALLFSAALFESGFGEHLRRRGVHLLERELSEQFLSDGGHFERSPMYHALLTRDLLELLALSRRHSALVSSALAAVLETRAYSALDYLGFLTMPDRSLPRFNDTVQDVAPDFDVLEEFASREFGYRCPLLPPGFRTFVLDASGYYGVRHGGNALIIDGGEVGPPHQPGHGHCDTLSFELCVEGMSVIVNCGNFDYEASAERTYARSTRAHNTVELDGMEQSEIWDVFRVGRRARPLYAKLDMVNGQALFRGAHDGYRRLRGRPTHVREIVVDPDFTIRLRDRIEGDGEHAAVSWLHFAPHLSVRQAGSAVHVADALGREVLVIDLIDAARFELLETLRFPAFGVRIEATTLALRAAGRLPLSIACRLIPAPAARAHSGAPDS